MVGNFYSVESFFDVKHRVWHGRKEIPKYGPNDNIGQIVLQSLRRNSESIGQICHHNGKAYTNGEIATLMIRIAQNIQKLNVKSGDIVGLCASNSDFVAPLFFGCIAVGLTVSTLDISFDKGGIKHTFTMTKPKIMFCDGGSVYQKIKEVFDECQLTQMIYTLKDHIDGVPTIDDILKATNQEDQFVVPPLKNGGDSAAAILCSSGTTGLPKGVTLSHTALLNRNALYLSRYPYFQSKDRILCFSTLYWMTGLIFLLYGTITGAMRIIVDRIFSPFDFFDIIQRYKINIALTVPSHLGQCLMSLEFMPVDLSSLEVFILTGSIVPYTLVEKFKQYASNAMYLTAYGMTETIGVITVGEIKNDQSVGKLVANMELKVLNDNDEPLKPNELGELCIRQPYHWAGYYDNPTATATTMDVEKWIHSGDIGYVNGDGAVFIVDRKKDILKYNNFHIFPNEIERIINDIPQVIESCVCGIPDTVYTYLLAAAVVKMPNANLTENDIYKYVADRVEYFKYLRGGVYFFDNLPKTASGKQIRRQITDLCIEKRNERMPRIVNENFL